MKKLLLAGFLLASMAAFAESVEHSANMNASATVIEDLSITVTSDIDFGTMIVGEIHDQRNSGFDGGSPGGFQVGNLTPGTTVLLGVDESVDMGGGFTANLYYTGTILGTGTADNEVYSSTGSDIHANIFGVTNSAPAAGTYTGSFNVYAKYAQPLN